MYLMREGRYEITPLQIWDGIIDVFRLRAHLPICSPSYRMRQLARAFYLHTNNEGPSCEKCINA